MEIPSELIEQLKTAKSVIFFSGAGISAESGIPTFRGKDGIWNKMKPEELANFDAFIRNPDLVQFIPVISPVRIKRNVVLVDEQAAAHVGYIYPEQQRR